MAGKDLMESYRSGKITERDIIVVDSTPLDIPPVAGLITSLESSENSHPALLLRQYKAFFAYVPNAYNLKFWKDLEEKNKNVFIRTEAGHVDTMVLEETNGIIDISPDITEAEMNYLADLKKINPIGSLAIDSNESRIVKIENGTLLSAEAYGAKARGLSFLQRNLKKENATDFVISIPIFFQKEFFKNATSKSNPKIKIIDLVKEIQSLRGTAKLEALASFRKEIIETSIPPELLSKIVSALQNLSANTSGKVFLRSSSNAEDRNNFNGAGLYDSKSADIASGESIERALKTVWASLYSDRAALAREKFGIDEASIGMGIVVVPFYSNLEAQGVALFKLNRTNTSGENQETIEGQMTMSGFPKVIGPEGPITVTSPPPGKIPEVVELAAEHKSNSKAIIRNSMRHGTSELPVGQKILSDLEYEKLYLQMEQSSLQWAKMNGRDKVYLDFEWGRLADGRLIIWQVREVPAEVNSSEGRYSVPILIGGRNFNFYNSADGESATGSSVLSLEQKVNLNISLNTVPLSKEYLKKIISSLKIQSREGTFEYGNSLPLTVENFSDHTCVEGPYGENPTIIGQDCHQLRIIYGIPTPTDSKRMLRFDLRYYLNAKNKKAVNPVVFVKDFHLNILTNPENIMPKDWASALFNSEFSFASKTILNGKSYLEGLLNYRPINVGIPSQGSPRFKFTTFIKIGKVSAEADWDTEATPRSTKHWDVRMLAIRFKGLLPRILEIENPAGITYSAVDHHGDEEFAADLSLSKGISSEELANLEKMGGRRVVLKNAKEIYSDKGTTIIPSTVSLIDNKNNVKVLATEEQGSTKWDAPNFEPGG